MQNLELHPGLLNGNLYFQGALGDSAQEMVPEALDCRLEQILLMCPAPAGRLVFFLSGSLALETGLSSSIIYLVDS